MRQFRQFAAGGGCDDPTSKKTKAKKAAKAKTDKKGQLSELRKMASAAPPLAM